MKAVVDKIPECGKECIFAEYVGMTSKYKCVFKHGLYSRCSLDCGKKS